MDALTFILIIAFVWIVLSSISRIPWFTVTNPRIGLGSAFYHTTRLNDLISRIGERGTKYWKLLWDIGIISGLGILFTGLIVFSINIISFFLPKSSDVTPIAITPVIPGITVSFASLPYFIVAIMIGAIVHEFAHGIAAINEKIPLKSTGIFVFLLFFGAFVEPEEEKILKASNRSKMRVMAAGGLANMVVAIFFLTILFLPVGFPLLISPLYETESSGALIINTVPDTPARQEGLNIGFAIIGVESEKGYFSIYSSSDFSSFVQSEVFINQSLTFHFAGEINPITIQTMNKSIITNKTTDNNTGYIGIATWNYNEPRFLSNIVFIRLVPYWLLNTMIYTFMVNLMLALMNLLPVPFLDGDKLLAGFLGEKNQILHKRIKYFALIVLVANFALSFLFMGWQQI
ncbi:MAG: site-2 protease family protein [Candidatus Hodarchaeales archaeon]|jgi:membrane-associated protease RseP (regulator of RpoE activity)